MKPIGQVLLRLMIRGASAGKNAHNAGDHLEDMGDVEEAMSMYSDAEAAAAIGETI